MATERPRVRVYQERPEPNVTGQPATMRACIVAPVYHIRDFLNSDDTASILIGAYGDTDAISDGVTNDRPLAGSVVIELADAPDNHADAVVDAASCVLYLTDVVVELATGTNGTFSTTAPDENLFTSSGANFITAGIAQHDVLVLADSEGNAYSARMVVQSVVSATQLRTYANFDASDFDDADLAYRVERALTGSFNVGSEFLTVDGNTIEVLGGVTVEADVSGDSSVETVPVSTAQMYLQYRSIRTDRNSLIEIESRNDLDDELGRLDYRNPARAMAELMWRESGGLNFYVVGPQSDDVDGYEAALGVIDSRLDVYYVVPGTLDRGVIDAVVDDCVAKAAADVSNFRLCLAPAGELLTEAVLSEHSADGDREIHGSSATVAVLATSTSFETGGVQTGDTLRIVANNTTELSRTVNVVLSDRRLSVTSAFPSSTTLSSRYWYALRPTPPTLANLGNAYAYRITSTNIITPQYTPSNPGNYAGNIIRLAGDLSTDHLILSWTDASAEAELSLESGGVTITAIDLGRAGNNICVQFTNTDGYVAVVAVTGVTTLAGVTTIAVTYDAGTATRTQLATAINEHATAGELVEVTVSSGGTALGTDPATSTTHFSGTAGKWALQGGRSPGFVVVAPVLFNVVNGSSAIVFESDGTGRIHATRVSNYSGSESIHTREPFQKLLDNTKSFLTGTPAVAAGDFVEIPDVAEDFSSVTRFAISSVLTNNRLLLASGYEFPGGNSASTTSASLDSYRIVRDYSKAQQSTALIDDIEPRASDRYAAVWPDQCSSVYVPNSATGAIPLTGSWLACAALAGLATSQPPQASLTRRALSTIRSLQNSSDRFTPTQIDAMAAGGLLVLQKSSPSAAPYVVVQALTDTGFTPLAEVSIRVLYDYVSRQFKAVLEAFIGVYSITDESVRLLRTNLLTTLNRLKTDRKPYVGPVLLDGSTVTDDIDIEAGTVEVIVDAVFPKPWGSSTLRIRGR